MAFFISGYLNIIPEQAEAVRPAPAGFGRKDCSGIFFMGEVNNMRRSEAHGLLELIFDGKDEASINAIIHTLRLSADATHYAHARKEMQKILVKGEKEREEQDKLYDFLKAHCSLCEDGRVQATTLYEKFQDWFRMNVSQNVWSQAKFGQLMRGSFDKIKSGKIYYKGLICQEGNNGNAAAQCH